MKKFIPAALRTLTIAALLLLISIGSFASHIVGMDLYYTWVSGNTYQVTLIAYANCSSVDSSSAFASLPTAVPSICVYNGNVSVGTFDLHIVTDSTREITPVCPADSLNTTCHNLASPTPGIKQYLYRGTYTLSGTSTVWRFIFDGTMGASSAGRAAAITNIASGTTIQLVDTLNNTIYSHNNPKLTNPPTPFFCLNNNDNYNPAAVDSNADGLLDSLNFMLVPAISSLSGCTTGPSVSYIAPFSATAPLAVSTPLTFSNSTGQLSFFPNALQRADVVYNVQQFRHDTLIGTCQREMTFLVLMCTEPPPTGNFVSATNGTVDDSFHFHICGDYGPFDVSLTPYEGDTSLKVTVTTSGLPAGSSFVTTNNGTNHPTCDFLWTSTGTPWGFYTFYVTYTDNNCPLQGTQTIAYTIGILPVPNVSYSILTPASCYGDAVINIVPGGTGKPWTVAVSSGGPDSVKFLNDSLAFTDSLPPGYDTLTIFTSVSNQCNAFATVYIPSPPPLLPTSTSTNPTYCGASDGKIILQSLNASGEVDTVTYSYNGVAQPAQLAVVSTYNTDTISGLRAGAYTNIIVKYGFCASSPMAATLNDPPFVIGGVTSQNPTECGFLDGFLYIDGLHPFQQDTVYYTFTMPGGTPLAEPGVSYYVLADGIATLSGLGAGTYSNIQVKTAGDCASPVIGPAVLTTQPVVANFDTLIHEGCHGDTVIFINHSSPLGQITYQWQFGDGSSDTAANPVHVYLNTTGASYTATLTVTNSKCDSSKIIGVNLNNFVHAGFSSTPQVYVCQDSLVTFVDTSTGTNLSYTWNFGDGTSSNSSSVNVTHTYPVTGNYEVTLIAANNVPCYDTFTQMLAVDSITTLKMLESDSVLCLGQAVTFSGFYSELGNIGVAWTFGDGSVLYNVNPVTHSFDSAGFFNISVNVTYRACPANAVTKSVYVFPYPSVDLGPDTSICAGGTPIVLSSTQFSNKNATWLWSTGDTTASVVVTTPGYYYVTETLNGCSTSDTVWVQNDCYMDMPNVFTPNGDGTNDYFYPRQYLTRGVIAFKMNIYNRWGENIFETSSTDGRGWDGNFNNTAQPEGVYIYQIDATFKDGQKEHRQGTITLLR